MNKAKLLLEKWGFHALLLPIFFIIHNYQQYHGLVSNSVAIKLLFEILIFSLIFFLIVWSLTRHVNKSLQLTTLAGFIFLFFGVIKDFFEKTLHAYFLARYSVFLLLLLIATVFLTRLILKKKYFCKSNLFQNLLLLFFLFLEGINLAVVSDTASLQKNRLTKDQSSIVKPTPDTVVKPDVYYLVFDCYPGTAYLRDYMQFDNSMMDSILKQVGFHVISSPKSNYNRTAFSIASTLNFQYLSGISNKDRITSKDYNHVMLTIKEPDVVKIFKSNKYKFYNLSIFEIDNVSPLYKEHFLTMPEESVMMYNNLVARLKRDVLWNFTSGKFSNRFVKKLFDHNKNEFVEDQVKKNMFNLTLIDSIEKVARNKSTTSSKFVYAHFELPHPPYFYNEKGESNDLNVVSDPKSFRDKSLFLSYLKYTNTVIRRICNQIIQASEGKAVIILQSDHGFTDFEGGPEKTELYFKNFTAFYFPDRNYSTLYDTLSNINTFPILFNKYFKSNIPLQKDSTVFLNN